MSQPKISSYGGKTSVILNTTSSIKHLIELISLINQYQALGMNQSRQLNLSQELFTMVAQDACRWVRRTLISKSSTAIVMCYFNLAD